MVIAFETKKIRQLCESNTKAKIILGNDAAEKLKHRLADLRAVNSVTELIMGNPRQVDHSDYDQYKVSISDDIFIYFKANHNSNPLLPNKDVDWTKVSRIKIVKIGSDHG